MGGVIVVDLSYILRKNYNTVTTLVLKCIPTFKAHMWVFLRGMHDILTAYGSAQVSLNITSALDFFFYATLIFLSFTAFLFSSQLRHCSVHIYTYYEVTLVTIAINLIRRAHVITTVRLVRWT